MNLTYFLNHNIKLPSFKPCQKTKIALAIADPGLTQRVHYSKLQVIHLSMLLDTSIACPNARPKISLKLPPKGEGIEESSAQLL